MAVKCVLRCYERAQAGSVEQLARVGHAWRSGEGLADSRYVLLCEPSFLADGSAYAVYQLLEGLLSRGSSWLWMLGQYGVRSCAYGGYRETAAGAWRAGAGLGAATVAIYLTDDAPDGPWCGWHTADGRGFPYAVIFRPRAEVGCMPWPELDSLTSVISHELGEALTDPIPGQTGNEGDEGEVGDVGACVWHQAHVWCPDGAVRVAQRLYSAADNACWPLIPGEATA